MANNTSWRGGRGSGPILDRYKNYLTKEQNARLKKLYKGIRQTTADENRDVYLSGRSSMAGVHNTASSLGLGAGYEARHQMAVNNTQREAGAAYGRQADARYTSIVHNEAQRTIRQREIERKKKEAEAAKKAAEKAKTEAEAAETAKNAMAQIYNTANAMVDYVNPIIEEQNKNAVAQQGADAAAITAASLTEFMRKRKADEAAERAKGIIRTPKAGVVGDEALAKAKAASRSAYLQQQTARQQTAQNALGQRMATILKSGMRTGNSFVEAPENASQADYIKRRDEANRKVYGSIDNPRFDVNKNEQIPLIPAEQKQVQEAAASMSAAEIAQTKIDYANAVAAFIEQYQKAVDAANEFDKAQSLLAEFNNLEAVARDTRNSPEQRRAAVNEMRGLQSQYGELIKRLNGFNMSAYAAGLSNAYDTLQEQRALLQAAGVEYSANELNVDLGWLAQGNQLTGNDSQLVQQANDIVEGKSATAKEFRSHLKKIFQTTGLGQSGASGRGGARYRIPESEQKWLRENGYEWIFDHPEFYEVTQANYGGNQYESFEDKVMDYLRGVMTSNHNYERYRNAYTTLADFEDLLPVQQDYFIGEGEKITGLEAALENYKHMQGGMPSSLEGQEASRVRLGLVKALGVDKDFITPQTMAALTDADIAFINYLYGKDDKQAAKDYLYELTEAANRASGEQLADAVSDAWPDHIKWVREFLWQMGYGSAGTVKNIGKIFKKEDTPMSREDFAASGITQNKIERGWSKFGANTLDSAAQSLGNNATSLVLGRAVGTLGTAAGSAIGAGIGKTVGSAVGRGSQAAGAAVGNTIGAAFGKIASHAPGAIMGASAAGQAKMEALREGYGNSAATVYGVINGISEAVLQEQVGGLVGFGERGVFTRVLSSVVDKAKSPLLRTLINGGLDVLSEIGQEEFGDVFENINRSVSLGEKRGLFEGVAEQAPETIVSTAISTILLNALGVHGQHKQERFINAVAEAANIKPNDARFLFETQETLNDGKPVSAKDLDRYNELTAVLTAAMPDDVAKAIESGKMNAVDWLTSEEGIVSGKLGGKLTKAEAAIETETEAVDHTEALKGKTDEQKRDYLIAATPTGKAGNAYYTTTDGKAIEFKNLDTTQKANYVLAQKCAKAFEGSVDVVIHDTLPLSNGAMVGNDGKLHIALDTTNEQGRESIAYWTLAHEAGHALKIADSEAWGEMFDVLTDYAKNYKDRDGKNLYDALVDSVTNQYKYDSNSDAFNDEMFSLIAERMVGSEGEQWAATLGDETIFDAIANDRNASAKAKKGFLGKLKTSVEKLSRQFRGGGFTKERKHLAKIREQLTEAYKRINEAPSIRDAAQARQAERRAQEEAEATQKTAPYIDVPADGVIPIRATSEKAESEAANGDASFSLRYNGEITERSMAYRSKHAEESADVSDDMLEAANDTINNMVKVMLPYLDKKNTQNRHYLPEEILGTTTFKNGSYGRTIENTTICFRTLAYIEFTNEIKKRIGRPLTVEESFLASQMLYDIAKEPQCLYCYVSLDRKAYDGFLLEYMKQRDNVAKEFNALSGEEQKGVLDAISKAAPTSKAAENVYKDIPLFNTFLDGRKNTAPMRARFGMWVNAFATGQKLITAEDLTTQEKRASITERGLVEQIHDAEAYAQAASWAKKLEEYRAYNGDILNMTAATVKKLNKSYGLRFYSFSEYTPAFIVENMQQVRDASLKGLYGLAYTKKVDFAKIFAKTGMNINVSTFGHWKVDSKGNKVLDADGNPIMVMDTLQGADWKEVQALREEFANVGAVFVATDDDAARWAKKQDWIDVVIPFHIVRTGANVAEFYKWVVHNSEQADLDEKGRKKDIDPPEHHNDYKTYLNLCAKRGLTPRFKSFLDAKLQAKVVAGEQLTAAEDLEMRQYMKFVNETRLSTYDSEKLRPVFDENEAKRSFDEFVQEGGYYGDWYKAKNEQSGVKQYDYNEAVDQVVSDIEQGRRANEVDYGRQDIDVGELSEAVKNRRNLPRAHGQSLATAPTRQSLRATDAEYLSLAEKYDKGEATEEEKQQLVQAVNDAAKRKMPNIVKDKYLDPVPLFHGTRFFGYTSYKDTNHATPFIYTSTLSSVAAHYAGDQNYAFRRDIGRKYDGGDSVEAIIKDAKSVWGVNYKKATDADKSRIYKDVRDEAVKVADKLDALHTDTTDILDWDNAADQKVLNAISVMEALFWDMRDGDNVATFDDVRGDEAMVESLLWDIDRYEESARKVKDFYYENAKRLNDAQRKYFRYLTGYDLGDAAIDVTGRIGRMLQSQDILVNPDGGLSAPEEARKALDASHNIGAYTWYGDLGENPFEFDANGGQFYALKVPEVSDNYVDTDTVCKWALEHGYTSVIMHNIYDYGDKADNYVFFSPSQIKSADPVTYDDNGDIIPLSERFNAGNEDIRYQIRNSENLVKDMTLPSLAINDRETAFTDLIFSGKKDIETRKYPLPKSIKGKWVPVVRTGKGINSVVGYVKFSGDKAYTAENFADDYDRHRVRSGSSYDIDNVKYGWIIEDYRKLDEPIEVGSRGFRQGNYVFRDLNGIIDNPNDSPRYQQRDFRIDFNVPQLDTKALHEAVKGGEGTVENRFEVKYEKTDAGFAVHITDKDSGKTYDRAETVTEGNAKAEAERAAAAVIRNIKRGRPDSKSKSTAGIYIEKGEMPARDVNVPVSVRKGMKTSKLARTIAEAEGMTDETVDALMEKVYNGFMSYTPDVNQESMDKALAAIEDDMSTAVTEWNRIANSGRILTPDDIALGAALMQSASKSGNIQEALEIAAQLQDLATTGGKLVQSFRMIKRLGAAGAYFYVRRQVAKINAELKKAAKDYQLVINKDLEAKLLAATDYHDIRDITEEMRKDLGRQLKPTLRDWLTAWRYTAMLGNIRTLDRNFVGNAGFVPIVMAKNAVNVALQNVAPAVSKAAIGVAKAIKPNGKMAQRTPFQKTTRLFASKEYTDFAKWDWNDQVKYDIKGNKYSEEKDALKDYMRYDTGAKGVLKVPAKIFNAWRSATTHAMEDEKLVIKGKTILPVLGDMAFKKAHYDYTLATRLQQQKVNTEMLKDVLMRSRNGETFKKDSEEARLLAIYEKATAYAQNEANRNTYNDINAFASFVSKMSRTAYNYEKTDANGNVKHPVRWAHYAIEGLLPFKNTPANIISRAVEYSPIGMAKTITLDLGRLIKGTISGEQFIDNLAKGITGSALFALGAILAKSGILRGALGYDDEKEKDLKRRGHQSYSVEIGGKSITLDWLAPESIPLFMGVEFFNQMPNMSKEMWDEKGLKAILNVTTGAFEPMLNMSMLQGVNALFEGFKSADDLGGLTKALSTVGTSYITQFQPTLLAQFARTLDPYRRTVYIDKDSKFPPFVNKFYQTALKKIPWATKLLTPYINEWGEKEETGPMWAAVLNNFLNPAYVNNLTETDVDREISRLFDTLGTDANPAFPDSANKYINYGGEKYNLTAREYEQYAILRGQTAYALANEMIKTDGYATLSDVEKVAAFTDAYAYADTIATSAILDMRLGDKSPDMMTLATGKQRKWVGYADRYAKLNGNSPASLAEYIYLRPVLQDVTKRDDRAPLLAGMNISPESKALLMEAYDRSKGYAEGSCFYNEKGKLLYDFANISFD